MCKFTRISLLDQSGIYNYWLSEMIKFEDSGFSKIISIEKYTCFALNITRLQGIYYLWLIGVVISIYSLVYEYYYSLTFNL